MKRLASPASVVAACGLIVVTNLAILAAAGWNRRGEAGGRAVADRARARDARGPAGRRHRAGAIAGHDP